MSVEYVHVGAHADILPSGRPVGPGDRVTGDELVQDGKVTDHGQQLIDDGVLVDVAAFDGDAASNAEALEEKAAAQASSRSSQGSSSGAVSSQSTQADEAGKGNS